MDDPKASRKLHAMLASAGNDPRARIACWICGQRFGGASIGMAAARFHLHLCLPKTPDAPR